MLGALRRGILRPERQFVEIWHSFVSPRRHGYFANDISTKKPNTNRTGRRHEKSSRTTDKRAADKIAKDLDAKAALRRAGVVDPQLDVTNAQGQRSIEAHLADYEAKMQAASRKPQHIETIIKYIQAIAEAAHWTSIRDISADTVNHYAVDLKERGMSARTVQAYLTAVKGFAKWLSRHGKLMSDPLASVSKPNPETDRRRERDILLPEEWLWLRPSTLGGSDRFGMNVAERVILYAVAIQTGLRQNELRNLTRGNLFLEKELPFITCKAHSTKNSKEARQYIQRDLAEELRRHVVTKAPGQRFSRCPRRTASRTCSEQTSAMRGLHG